MPAAGRAAPLVPRSRNSTSLCVVTSRTRRPADPLEPLRSAQWLTEARRKAIHLSFIVLPQAIRNMLPVLLTQTIILFQDTSLVYVISSTDFLGAAVKVANRDGRLVEMYTFAALVYFVICFTASMYVRRLQSRISIIR